MPETLKQLQGIAWSLENFPDELKRIKVLKMPIRVQQKVADVSKDWHGLPPISSLHDTLATASHSIIAFAPEVYKSEKTYPNWLYAISDTSLDLYRLITLINKWLQATGEPNRISNTAELHWDWDTIDVMTANFRQQRMVIPNQIARWLITQKFQLQLSGQSYQLYLVPLVSHGRYATELITEPIVREESAFSFVMRFWLEQLPYESEPRLLHKIGIRRWATEEVKIYYGRGKSLYLRRSAGYLDNASREDVFTRITVKNFGGDHIDYAGKQADLLDLLSIDGELPPIKDFLQNPSYFQQVALMPIENSHSRNHAISTGLESSDHREIFNQLSEIMGTFAKPLSMLSRINQGDKLRKRMHHKTDHQDKLAQLPYPSRIEIHSPTHFKDLVNTILDVFDLPIVSTNKSLIQFKDENGNIRLEIAQIVDKQLTDTLIKDKNYKRLEYIEEMYPLADVPTGILIELLDYRNTKLSKKDPKQIIRRGMTKTRRISQFFQPKSTSPKDYEHRIEKAVADLLRMLGYRQQPFYTSDKRRQLPEQIDILGFWVFQLNRNKNRKKTTYLPVVAEVPYGHQHLRLIIPSETGRSECYPSLYEGIKALAGESVDFSDPNRVINFFQSAIEERESNNPTLLILSDEKLRRYFEELKDTTNNSVSLFGILDDAPNIRLARLRLSRNGDAPFCVPPEPKSKYQGLYGVDENSEVFYSLHNIGHQHKHSQKRKLDDLKTPSSNPSTILIQLCNLQEGDNPAEWAGLVHRLRLASSHIDTAVVLPQPLHDLEAIKTYIPDYSETYIDEDLNAIADEE